jgi:hypothetical protein
MCSRGAKEHRWFARFLPANENPKTMKLRGVSSATLRMKLLIRLANNLTPPRNF